MADYYSILKKTISGLANNSQATRAVVYGKARAAIDRQLRAIEPAPSEDAIARQLQLLEAAIDKLDGEFTEQAPAPASPEPQPVPQPEPTVDAQPEAEIPIADAVSLEPAAAQIPVVAQVEAVEVSPAIVTPVVEQPVGGIAAIEVPAGIAVEPSVAGMQPVSQTVTVDPQGMEYDETILASEPGIVDEYSNGAIRQKNSGGVIYTLIMALLVLGIVGGGAYALWVNKDALMGVFSSGEKPMTEQMTEQAEQPEQNTETSAETNETMAQDAGEGEESNVRVVGEPATPKTATQLTPQGETLEVEPVQNEEPPSTETAQIEDSVVPQSPEVIENEAVENTVQPEVSEVGDQAATDTPEVQTEETAQNTEAATPVTTSPLAVAQKAFLYEEGRSGTNASRDNAAIIWTLGEEAVEGGANEAVIIGQLDVPGRDLSMRMMIKRNRDTSLPASHIIEIEFKVPADFSGGNVSDVSRFVLKTSEQARGEGLVAVPAKISDGNFLIALNNLDQALVTNRKLLLDSTWIDVPMGYTSGKRALVTLEKGAVGGKVFRDAFANWDAH